MAGPSDAPRSDGKSHWESVYQSKDVNQVSWYQDRPTPSLDLIVKCNIAKSAAIVDVGGGASVLVDYLLDAGYSNLTVLDISAAAMASSQTRLGGRAAMVNWHVADVTTWQPASSYDLWHDRAVLHFLIDLKEQEAYARAVSAAVRPGGYVIIGGFAPDGPQRCSGLPVVRHDTKSLGDLLGPNFTRIESRRNVHRTPRGDNQAFLFCVFRCARQD